MADDIAKMRAALTDGASVSVTGAPAEFDNAQAIVQSRSLPDLSTAFKPIEALYQNMPGAALVQGIIPTLEFPFQVAGSALYGLGKQIFNPSDANFDRDTTKAMQALQYTPPTQAGKNVANTIAQAPEAITGSSMPISPLPEIWNNPPRFTPEDLRAGATSAITDVRNFPMDYANAKMGLQREYPTLGSRAAGVTDTATAMAKPLAEIAYNQVMENGNIKMPGGLPDIPVYNYAVKPKGGNWPTNLGSTERLSTQGELGMHLADAQISDPAIKWFEHLPRQVRWDWDRYINTKIDEHGGSLTPQQKQAYAEDFTKEQNTKREQNNEKPITLPSQYAAVAPQYNAWVMGPYQKYITNQMGTGLSFDPLLQIFNDTDIPINELLGTDDYHLNRDTDYAIARRKDYLDKLTGYGRGSSFDPNAPQNINVGKQTATTPTGIAVENALDAALYPKGIYAFPKEEGYPQSARLSHFDVVNDFLNSDIRPHTVLPAIQKKVLDDLIAGKADVNKLSNATPAVVAGQIIKEFKDARKSKEAVKKAKDIWRQARFKDIQSDIPYNDGSKMHLITPEDAYQDENLVARDLGQSTIDLNQCVGAGCRNTVDYPDQHGPFIEPHTGKAPRGTVEYDKFGYMRRLKNGEIQIARLLDPNGVAQATVRIDTRKTDLQGTGNNHKSFIENWIRNATISDPKKFAEWRPVLANFNPRDAGERQAIFDLLPGLETAFNKYFKPEPEKRISEMKGKDNGDIPVQYVPHMMDWLNKLNASGELTDVSDLSHLPEVHDLERSFDAVGKMSDQRKHWYSPTVEYFFNKVEDEKALPRFFTTDQFAEEASKRGIDLSAELKNEADKYPKGASAYLKDMIDYFEPGAIRPGYASYQRIISFDPRTMNVKVQGVKKDAEGNWVDIPRDIRIHSTMPDLNEFQKAMGRPRRRENELANGAHEMEPDEQDHVNAIRQRAYENASEMVRGLYTTDFLRRLYEGDMDARQSIVTDMVVSPRTYGLTNYSPAARNAVIERIMQEGIFWPHENPREE